MTMQELMCALRISARTFPIEINTVTDYPPTSSSHAVGPWRVASSHQIEDFPGTFSTWRLLEDVPEVWKNLAL